LTWRNQCFIEALIPARSRAGSFFLIRGFHEGPDICHEVFRGEARRGREEVEAGRVKRNKKTKNPNPKNQQTFSIHSSKRIHASPSSDETVPEYQ
jgi:hypothetical protein